MLAFTVGEAFIVALAARQELPAELYAVARLEGASAWFVLRTVTLPLMAPVLALLATRDVAVSLQATFTATYLLTDGGPDRATLFLPIYSFDMGFELLRYGYASAMMLLGVPRLPRARRRAVRGHPSLAAGPLLGDRVAQPQLAVAQRGDLDADQLLAASKWASASIGASSSLRSSL